MREQHRTWTVMCVTVILFVILSGMAIVALVYRPGFVTEKIDFAGYAGMLAILFTFATMIVGLFGIINYFHANEAYRTLCSVEKELLWSQEDIIVNRTFSSLLRRIPTSPRPNNYASGRIIAYSYEVAASVDIDQRPDDLAGLRFALLELYQCGGLGMLNAVVGTFEGLPAHKGRYRRTLREARSLHDSLYSSERNLA